MPRLKLCYSGLLLSVPVGHAILIAAILCVATIVNVMCTTYNFALLQQLQLPAPKEHTYIGSDYPAELPLAVPAVGLEIETTEPYYALVSDADWKSVYPQPGMGFTSLGPNNRTFLVSMYHQLHCLDVIRVGYIVNGSHAYEHIEHCLRYLRQIVLCKADTTLDIVDATRVNSDGTIDMGTSGLGMIHRCRDWTRIRRYLERRD